MTRGPGYTTTVSGENAKLSFRFCCPITLKRLNNGAIQKLVQFLVCKETAKTQNQALSAVPDMRTTAVGK